METRRDVDVVLNGASFFAYGFAAAYNGRVLIVERTTTVGAEFLYSFDAGFGWDEEPTNGSARALRDDAARRNLLAAGSGPHLPGFVPVLADCLIAANVPVLFHTDARSIERTAGGGLQLEVVTPSGVEIIATDAVIDTTSVPRALGHAAARAKPGTTPGGAVIERKSLAAILHHRGRDGQDAQSNGGKPPSFPFAAVPDGWQAQAGRFPAEVYVALDVSLDASVTAARRQLVEGWQRRSAELRDWRVAAVAFAFAYRGERGPVRLEDGRMHYPSYAYGNPISATDAGECAAVER